MRAVCTVGVADKRDFSAYQARFERSIRQTGFHAADRVIRWRNHWPPGSPSHTEVNYGFKIYAIKDALARGADRVIYLDVACHAIRSLEPIWQQVERDGHFFLVGDDRLGNLSSDLSLAEYDVPRDEAMNMLLFSGTIIGLDFRSERTKSFFEEFCDHASAEFFNCTHVSGVRGGPGQVHRASLDPRCWEHRADEPYLTLIANKLKMQPTAIGGYFIGDRSDIYGAGIIQSGYTEDHSKPIEPVLEEIAEHTIDAALVGAGGWVLDAGCRNFGFASELARRGCRVIAMDPDPTIDISGGQVVDGVTFLREALSVNEGEKSFVMTDDPQARHVAGANEGGSAERVTVKCTSIETIMERFGVDIFDCVKLDIEGGEIGVLKAWPGPIARQISIEFHEHCFPVSQETFNEIFSHLGNWYRVVQDIREERHGAGMNRWDTLLVIR